jgi:hypothetical protein
MRKRPPELSALGVYVIAVVAIVAGSERSMAQDPEVKPKRFIEP